MLVDAGADVNARFVGRHTETPLHWAASCDDVDVLDALLDRGADIEADGAVIGGGTPVLDATAFGQWDAARRLVERGAETRLWPAATLGLLDRVEAELVARPPTREEVTEAFWGACHGGQRATAERLLAAGAEINWVGWDDLTPLDAAEREGADDVVAWLTSIGGVERAGLSSGRGWTGSEDGLRFEPCPQRNTMSRCSSASLLRATGPTRCSPTSSPATATSRTS